MVDEKPVLPAYHARVMLARVVLDPLLVCESTARLASVVGYTKLYVMSVECLKNTVELCRYKVDLSRLTLGFLTSVINNKTGFD